jgi:AcrR family transcriptional regulator
MTTPTRPLRKDAERNRQRILAAASEVFAEHGLAASLDDIAHHAGVGVGTVYRRFPDKEQLIDALFEDRVTGMVALAQEGLAIEDPWDGLVHFLTRATELQAVDRGLKEAILSTVDGRSRVAAGRERIAPEVHRLLERAKAAGVVRQDVQVPDLPLMQFAVGAMADYVREVSPDAWRRLFTLVLDGLRATGPDATPMPVPALDQDELEQAMLCAGSTLARRRRA